MNATAAGVTWLLARGLPVDDDLLECYFWQLSQSITAVGICRDSALADTSQHI